MYNVDSGVLFEVLVHNFKDCYSVEFRILHSLLQPVPGRVLHLSDPIPKKRNLSVVQLGHRHHIVVLASFTAFPPPSDPSSASSSVMYSGSPAISSFSSFFSSSIYSSMTSASTSSWLLFTCARVSAPMWRASNVQLAAMELASLELRKLAALGEGGGRGN